MMPPPQAPVHPREAFDRIASSYDHAFDSLPATQRLRRHMRQILLRCFAPGSMVLELNCGTGTDALALAASGIRVHATDASPTMVHEAQTKATRVPHGELVTTGVLSFAELAELRQEFDGAFSDMGGLNCAEDIHSVARDIARLVRPGGCFVASVMTDFCLWETVAFLLRGRPEKMFRRRRVSVAHVGGLPIQIRYFSPARFARAFIPWFEPIEIVGLNVFTPPPTSQRAYSGLGRLNTMLEALDDTVAPRFPFNRMGDHFVIVLKRTTERAP